jgi:hypothetical protein
LKYLNPIFSPSAEIPPTLISRHKDSLQTVYSYLSKKYPKAAPSKIQEEVKKVVNEPPIVVQS